MTGRRYKNDDVARRDAFKWNETGEKPMVAWMKSSGKVEPGQNTLTPSVQEQLRDPESLLRHYLRLSELRQASSAIRQGNFTKISWAGFDSSYTLAWIRESDTQWVLVLHNLESSAFTAIIPQDTKLALLWTSSQGLIPEMDRVVLNPGQALSLGPVQSAVYEILK